MRVLLIVVIALLNVVHSASGAGVVAETHGGKLVLFEWNTHGTGIPPVFDSATLKIIDRKGETLFQENFTRKHLAEYDEKKLDGGKYEVRLLIRRAKSTFDLHFSGTERETEYVDEGKEIEELVRILRKRGRALEPGSSLLLETPIGEFTFRDLICGIYGDV